MKKILGLDIGISSIGYSVINYDDSCFNGEIIKTGVRIFTAAEQPKTGASLAEPRRIARGSRRRLSRRSSRLYNIKKLMFKNNIITSDEIENLYLPQSHNIDIWTLRKEALNRKLSNDEFYRILVHIAKRRGFKSIRKSEEAKNEGKLLKAIKTNIEDLKSKKFLTIGEMFATIYTEDTPKRNKKDDYKNSIPRSLLEEEVKIIFKKQKEFGNGFATEEILKDYLTIAFYQRPLQSMDSMIGNCTFEKDEKRAPKGAYSSEIFTALTKLVNTSIISEFGIERFLTSEEIQRIIELSHENVKVTYKQIRKLLELFANDRFKNLKYDQQKIDKKTGEKICMNPEEDTFIELKQYHKIKNSIKKSLGENYFEEIKQDKNLFNNIAIALTYEKSDENVIKKMQKFNIPDKVIECVKDLSMNKVMHLSIKAIDKIIPFMSEGQKYNEACLSAGYNHSVIETGKEKQNLLPVLSNEELTTNPVVNRAISQTRKVVNALIRTYGKFDSIIIETARDLSKSHQERIDIKKGQDEFKTQKEAIKKRCIEEYNINPEIGNNLLRVRLWEEQGGKCVYSGKSIDVRRLSEPNYTDIDHIIPYSRSFDDSLNNKVLCLADENRQKGNKIPYEYIGETNWYSFVEKTKSLHLKDAKFNRLVRKTYDQEGFKTRNLNDTRYISRFIKDYIKENLDFDNNLKVETRNGSLTAFLRKQWGLIKNREENDRHHALDAIVIACSTQGMVKYLSTISAQRENYDFINGSKPKFKKPWNNFSEDIEKAISGIFVSRAIRAKATGQIHDDTIRSPKHLKYGFTTKKTPLEDIKLETLENMFDKERNIVIYNILKERLEKFDNNPKKAFEEPVYMPLKNSKKDLGVKPHRIKTIKIKKTGTSGIKVHNGFANNASMIRVDVFNKKNKKGKNEFFFVPIYLSDFSKENLPNKAISSQKSGWIEMDNTYHFNFSLYPDTLISINMTGKPEDNKFYYYKGCDIDSGRILLDTHDRSIANTRISPKSAYSMKKYQVGLLGDYNEVKKEKRLKLKRKSKK